jgi:Fe-S cluster biogenesis protein NfuA
MSSPQKADSSLTAKVEAALNTIRPYLEADGGDIRISEISEAGVLKVEFLGNCAGCTMSSMTFRAGVEEAVKRMVPEIRSVEALN